MPTIAKYEKILPVLWIIQAAMILLPDYKWFESSLFLAIVQVATIIVIQIITFVLLSKYKKAVDEAKKRGEL